MIEQLLSVFLESKCPFCSRTTSDYICQYCSSKLSSHQFQSKNHFHWWGDLPLFAWGRYEGQLKNAIALMKYNNHPELGIVLGRLLAKAWLASNLVEIKKISVVPIPLHRHKRKDRGFNQAEKIARGFCQQTGYNLSAFALIRVRETKAMFDLNPEARIKNLQDAFSIGKKLPQYPVLLIDDIFTLGTTVRASAEVLRRHKIQVIGSVVVAKVKH